MDKQKAVCAYNEILFSLRMKIVIPATIWMNLENITLRERRQARKSMYYMIPFLRNAQYRQIYRNKKVD